MCLIQNRLEGSIRVLRGTENGTKMALDFILSKCLIWSFRVKMFMRGGLRGARWAPLEVFHRLVVQDEIDDTTVDFAVAFTFVFA